MRASFRAGDAEDGGLGRGGDLPGVVEVASSSDRADQPDQSQRLPVQVSDGADDGAGVVEVTGGSDRAPQPGQGQAASIDIGYGVGDSLGIVEVADGSDRAGQPIQRQRLPTGIADSGGCRLGGSCGSMSVVKVARCGSN